MKAAREAQAKAQTSAMAAMQFEGYKSNRRQRELEASSEGDARRNAKLQSELRAHADGRRAQLDKDATRSMFAARTEALKGVKQQRSFADAQQREMLENDKLQSEMTNHVRCATSVGGECVRRGEGVRVAA